MVGLFCATLAGLGCPWAGSELSLIPLAAQSSPVDLEAGISIGAPRHHWEVQTNGLAQREVLAGYTRLAWRGVACLMMWGPPAETQRCFSQEIRHGS